MVVDGVLRLGEQPGEFVPANQPAKGEWYYLNAGEMAQACDLPQDTPFVELVTGEAGQCFASLSEYSGRAPGCLGAPTKVAAAAKYVALSGMPSTAVHWARVRLTGGM